MSTTDKIKIVIKAGYTFYQYVDGSYKSQLFDNHKQAYYHGVVREKGQDNWNKVESR